MTAAARRDRPSPTVSVIAASMYSAESAAEQDYPGLDLICLDDAGPGEGLLLLAQALARTAGELVVYLGPGDSLFPGAIARLAGALSARPAAGLAYPAYRLLDGRGEVIGMTVPEELDFTEMLMFQHAPVGPGAMFRRDLALRVAPDMVDSSTPSEFAFWLKLAELGGACRLIDVLAARRSEGERAAREETDAARWRLAILDRILAEERPATSEAAIRSAARSACVLAAMEFKAGFNGPEDRFFVADRLSTLDEGSAAADDDAEVARLEAHIVNLEQRLLRHRAVLPVLEATVAARESRLAGEDAGPGRSWRSVAKRLVRGGDER